MEIKPGLEFYWINLILSNLQCSLWLCAWEVIMYLIQSCIASFQKWQLQLELDNRFNTKFSTLNRWHMAVLGSIGLLQWYWPDIPAKRCLLVRIGLDKDPGRTMGHLAEILHCLGIRGCHTNLLMSHQHTATLLHFKFCEYLKRLPEQSKTKFFVCNFPQIETKIGHI